MGKKVTFYSTLIKNDGAYHCCRPGKNIYFHLAARDILDKIIAQGGEIKVTIEDDNNQKGTNNE